MHNCQYATASVPSGPSLSTHLVVPQNCPSCNILLLLTQVTSQSEGPAVVISHVPAGSVIDNLGLYCVDEVGQPVHNGTQGKVQLSWCRGTKKVMLEEGVVCLPELQVS